MTGLQPPQPAERTRPFFRLKRNLIGGFIMLTVAAGWASGYRATQHIRASLELSTQTREVIATIRTLGNAMLRAGALSRGFLQTSPGNQVVEFRASVAKYRREAARLRQLVNDEPDQIVRLDALDALVLPRLTAIEEAMVASGEAAPPLTLDDDAMRRLDEISDRLDDIETHQHSLAALRVTAAWTGARRGLLVLTLNAIIAVLGVLAALLLFNRDVRRQRQKEARLRGALQDADAASEAKTHFLATVSHEIRTPLNAVAGMSELLLDTRLDPEQMEFAKAVHNNAEALSMLIGDLLDSSRIEAGQVFLDSAPFDVRELVEGVADLLAVRAEAKGVPIVVDVPPAAPRRLVGDRNRLRQVLTNLVGNAVKFTEQGNITIRVRVDAEAAERANLTLAVIDTGIGIAPEAQSRVFGRFIQADRSTARRYGGTGLGLNISRSLIELMGGRLTLQSELGRGSTVEASLTLPLAPVQPAPDFGPASLAGVDVILIQETAVLRDVNAGLLRFAGATVRTAGTAADGLALIAERAPQVLALGEGLPGRGVEFAKAIWRDRYRAASAINVVLICSLRARAADSLGAYGIVAAVYKPVKQARLIHAVRQAAGLEAEPVAREPDHEAAATEATAIHRRILLVEDNRDNWTLATRILTEAGYEVDRAEDGSAAVTSAAARAYDLVLMDVELPEVDGIEATRRIRAREAGRSGEAVPIVALTAHAVEAVRQQALEAGMNDYATKPFDKRMLLDVCAKWIDNRPLLLIADDTPDNQVLLTKYLRGSDYRLVFVSNGRDAVEAVTRHRVSMVLLDMNMPIMDGYEAARTMRRVPGGESVPILALTSHDGPQERERCLAAGCTDFLSKPVRRADFLARVAALLGHHRMPVDVTESDTARPRVRDISDCIQRALAMRDFVGLGALAAPVGAAARAQQLDRLAAASEELVNAAHDEDAERSAWWSEQLVAHMSDVSSVDAGQNVGQPSGSTLDAVARLATLILDTPAAIVTVVSGDRVDTVGSAGVPRELNLSHGTPIEKSFTRFIIAHNRPLLVEDVRTDPQLRDAPPTKLHGMVAMAGVPLTIGRAATPGAVAALDHRPRRWPPREVAMLAELAALATRLLEADGSFDAEPPSTIAGGEGDIVVDDDIVDLVPEYVAARRHDVLTLRERLEGGDLDAIAGLGHKMKGSGSGYGLPEVSRLGRGLEDAAREGDAGAIAPLIDDLERHLGHLRVRSADGRVSMEL